MHLIWPGSEHLTSILETENMRAKKSVFTPQDALTGLHPMARIALVLQDATYVPTFGPLAYAPSAGVWAASGLLAYSPQVGVRAAFPYCVLGCVPGRLSGFLFTTYPETMPPRIPVFSHSVCIRGSC